MKINKKFKDLIGEIGKERIKRWIFIFSIGLVCTGIFEFFYIWIFRYQLIGYLLFAGDYTLTNFIVQFIQVYSVLFIPLMVFLSLQHKESNKFNNKKIKILTNLLLIIFFSLLVLFYHHYGVWEWVFLFMPIFIIISLKFNLMFAFSFSYLSFYCANMFFEFQGLNFIHSFGTLLSYILVFGIFIFVLVKMKIKIDLLIISSFILIICYWVYFYSIWQLKGIEFTQTFLPYDLYVRLFTFPFFIIITVKIYLAKKHIQETLRLLT